MKVILLGKGKMLANMIESAIEANVEIAGVLRYERTVISGIKLFFNDLFKTNHDLTLIKKHKIKEIKCNSVNCEEFKNFVIKTNTDIILVGTWNEKIKKEIFNLPKIGSINIHPSLLPRYRGPNPYMRVILNGEKKSGVTLHLIDENFDTGAVLLQKEIDVLPDDTGKELRERTYLAARELCRDFLIKIQTQVIIPIKQNESRASYFGHVNEIEKMLDFKNKTADEIYKTVKALHPWLPCYITIKNKFLKVDPYKIEIESSNEDTLKNILISKMRPEESTTKVEDNSSPGCIINKSISQKSLSIKCKDGKVIKFNNLKLYGVFLRPFTKYFIKNIDIEKDSCL